MRARLCWPIAEQTLTQARWHTPNAGMVYEYKYAVVASDGITPLAWQGGGNSVIALQVDVVLLRVYNWVCSALQLRGDMQLRYIVGFA